MCGRYSLTTPVEALRRLFRFAELPNLAPRYNIAPTQTAPIVRPAPDSSDRTLSQARWGLIPPWTTQLKGTPPMINARAETVASKPTFRVAFAKRRCLVPADGYYEWRQTDGKKPSKQPWRITLESGEPFALAGLWDSWRDPDSGAAIESFAIVTTAANETIAPLHDRMPVILPESAYAPWLDPAATATATLALLKPYGPGLKFFRVSTLVNKASNDQPGVIEPIP
jgi:putative SOS response-associated peptidase YedK